MASARKVGSEYSHVEHERAGEQEQEPHGQARGVVVAGLEPDQPVQQHARDDERHLRGDDEGQVGVPQQRHPHHLGDERVEGKEADPRALEHIAPGSDDVVVAGVPRAPAEHAGVGVGHVVGAAQPPLDHRGEHPAADAEHVGQHVRQRDDPRLVAPPGWPERLVGGGLLEGRGLVVDLGHDLGHLARTGAGTGARPRSRRRSPTPRAGSWRPDGGPRCRGRSARRPGGAWRSCPTTRGRSASSRARAARVPWRTSADRPWPAAPCSRPSRRWPGRRRSSGRPPPRTPARSPASGRDRAGRGTAPRGRPGDPPRR